MDKTIPPAAALLLDFIGDTEAPQGYDTIFGNNQHKLATPITRLTLGELRPLQKSFTNKYGSSATGRYQFMYATLGGLIDELRLRMAQIFDADLQDRLAFHLLIRRGYYKFINDEISATEFGKRLAQEWASFPVLAPCRGAHRDLKRGQSYYAGDGVNKALVSPDKVEDVLYAMKNLTPAEAKPIDHVEVRPPEPMSFWQRLLSWLGIS